MYDIADFNLTWEFEAIIINYVVTYSEPKFFQLLYYMRNDFIQWSLFVDSMLDWAK